MCLAKDRHGNPCRNHFLPQSRFCKFHSHMHDYTEDMLQNLSFCKGCNKWWHLEEGKTCSLCKSRDKSVYKTPIVKCKHESCKFQKSQENDYCGKHQLCVFIEETKSAGKKTCYNVNRGCRSPLDSEYSYSKCQDCLAKDREKDNFKRALAKEAITESGTKQCSSCCRIFDLSHFEGEAAITKTCISCRAQNKRQDQNRDKTHRNLVAKQNSKQVYRVYQKEAVKRGLDFQISREEVDTLILHPCHYCSNVDEEKKFNGIDRIDSNIGYYTDNCVSCCKMCNYLKNNTSKDVFLKRVEHILTYLKLINGALYPELFRNVSQVGYSNYISSAKQRNIVFELNKPAFDTLVSGNCYLCGKMSDATHCNGIDRFDNTIGYIESNCKTCCHTCNMMKHTYSYDTLIGKFIEIQKGVNSMDTLSICRN